MRYAVNTKTALVSGASAGIGGSACCLGPLLLLSLGIGGVWIGHLTALERYRPIFIGLALIFLGLAFRSLYLVPRTCDSRADCVADRTQSTQRLIFWIVTPLLFGLIAVPWLVALLNTERNP